MIDGIPQRMQLILREYEADSNGNSTTTTSTSLLTSDENSSTRNVNITWLNIIIKSWAYSNEHLRGTMAENVFKSISYNSSDNRSNSNIQPNGITYRNIIHAWCLSTKSSGSGERRCAFIATGHYMQWLRYLSKRKERYDLFGNDTHTLILEEEQQPTMEDYHILFNAWTTAT